MKEIVRHFDRLTAEQILESPAGAFGDYELLDVLAHFDDQDDEDRYTATVELILRSPECSELVDYSGLYDYLVMDYQSLADYEAAARWAYAWLVYSEQHEGGADRAQVISTLAEIYRDQGDVDTSLALYVRRVQTNLSDLDALMALAFLLADSAHRELAQQLTERCLAQKDYPHYEYRRSSLERLYQEITNPPVEEPAETVEVNPQMIAALEEALAHEGTGAPEETETEHYLPPVAGLLDAGEALDQALHAEIVSQGRILAPELVRLAFDREQAKHPASAHAIALLGAISPSLEAEFTELRTWLERAEGNWQDELLSKLMGKVGGYTSDELERFAADRRYDESIRSMALTALTERALKVSELRPRVVSFFAEMLQRPEAAEASEEDFNGALIMEILDLDARELYPQVKAAFDEDRVPPMLVGLAEVHEEWDLEPIQQESIPDDVLYLHLECTACGRVRPHTTRYLLINQDDPDSDGESRQTRFDSCILDHEIVCPKCGARDRYKLTPQASFAVFAPRDPQMLLAMISGNPPESPPKLSPNVFMIRAAAFGRSMHPLEALEEYRWRTAMKPGDADLRLGYAKVLRTLFRYEQALEEFRFALELAPNEPEVLITAAMAEHDLGDPEAARRCYQRILELEMGASPHPDELEISDYSLAAAQGLEALERGETSDWFVPAYNTDGEMPPASPSRTPKEQRKSAKKRSRRRKRRR